jgi:hypothetical protein
MCYERTRDQGTLGSIAIAIVEPLGGHLLCISCWSQKKHGSRVARIKKRRVELSRKLAKVCP